MLYGTVYEHSSISGMDFINIFEQNTVYYIHTHTCNIVLIVDECVNGISCDCCGFRIYGKPKSFSVELQRKVLQRVIEL